MTLGGGAICIHSTKQKINTRISTEAELVGVDDISSHVLWTRYFLISQGYQTNGTTIYQVNQSAILLEKNGIHSRGKRSKHIAIHYFFIKDRVQSGEINIKWCPSEDMVGDFFTKPLQGTLFYKFRRIILNLHQDRSE